MIEARREHLWHAAVIFPSTVDENRCGDYKVGTPHVLTPPPQRLNGRAMSTRKMEILLARWRDLQKNRVNQCFAQIPSSLRTNSQ